MRKLLPLLALACLFGCAPKQEEPVTQAPETQTGGPAPIGSGAVGGLTPMTGTESLQGGGSGIGSAAKSQAMGAAAAAAGGGSAAQLGDE